MRPRFWLPLLLCLLPRLAAASPIVLDGRSDRHALIDHIDGLEDAAGELGIDEVAARELTPLGDLQQGVGRWPGQQHPILWLHFAIDVPAGGTPDDWYLIVGRPYSPGTVYVEEEPGHYRAIDIRLDPDGGSFRARLPAAAGTHDVFLRVPGPLNRPSLLHVATATGYERLLQPLLTAQGVYLGVMLAMLLINLLVGVLLRNRAQLWYVGFIAASVGVFSLLNGTVSRLVAETVPATATYRLLNVCLAMTVIMGIQFSRLFLDTPRTAPRSDRVMRGFLALAAVVLVAVCVAPDLLSTRAVAVLGALVPLVALSAGVSAFRSGSRWARFYLVGWSFFSVGGLFFAVPIPVPFDAASVFQLTSVLETALFSMALADRLRILGAERAAAARALKQAELQAARGAKLAALGQLVAGVAHEVNNPNNFLTFNLPILQDYLDATRPHLEAADRARGAGSIRLFDLSVEEFYKDATALVGNMQHGAERIAGIVSQLKSYVRHSDEVQWEEGDVNRVVANAVTLVRTQLRQWVEHVELHLGDGLPPVRMNPGQMEQVVINLMLNAGQAARTSANGRVDVRTRREGDVLVIAVEDNGPGVPEPIRDHIFEPFFTTKTGELGTGMGLAISQRIVDEHGGTLELSNAVAQGACFVVRLPITAEQT